jgi:hypothetical protein
VDRGLGDPAEQSAPGGVAFRAVAQPSRRTPAAIALAAIAVLVVALLTKQAAPAASAPIASVAPRPAPAEAVTSSVRPVVATVAAPTPGAPSRNPTVTPYPTFLAVPAEGGATRLIPAGPTPVRLTIALPDGWQKATDAMYVKPGGAGLAGMSIGAWSLRHVNTFPCRWAAQAFADGPLMRTAAGQAEALSSWWGQDPGTMPYWNSKIAPLASKPQPTTIQGHPAWYLDVLIPSTLDLSECDGGQLILWDTANGDVRYSQGPGEVNRLWVVDVGGEVMVIDAAIFLETPAADVAELQKVIDSVVIEP